MGSRSGGVGADTILGDFDGSDFDDSIWGLGGDDSLTGASGDDNLYGGVGNDTLNGGTGDDYLDGNEGNDTLHYTSGTDTLEGGNGNDVVIMTGSGDAFGSSFSGGDGYDVIHMGEFYNFYFGGFEEYYLGNLSNEFTVTDEWDEIIYGEGGDDRVSGNGGNDRLYGGDDNDVLIGGEGDDLLHGGDGTDTASYFDAGGAVTVNLTSGPQDTIGAGRDRLVSIENLEGSEFNDALTGNGQANRLIGGAGDDVLKGGNGDDVLVGGIGADLLYGGAGADIIVLTSLADSTQALAGRDVVTGFKEADGDRIDLSQIDANNALSGDQPFAFIGSDAFSGAAGELRYAVNKGDLVLMGDVNGDRVSDFALRIENTTSLSGAAVIL